MGVMDNLLSAFLPDDFSNQGASGVGWVPGQDAGAAPGVGQHVPMPQPRPQSAPQAPPVPMPRPRPYTAEGTNQPTPTDIDLSDMIGAGAQGYATNAMAGGPPNPQMQGQNAPPSMPTQPSVPDADGATIAAGQTVAPTVQNIPTGGANMSNSAQAAPAPQNVPLPPPRPPMPPPAPPGMPVKAPPMNAQPGQVAGGPPLPGMNMNATRTQVPGPPMSLAPQGPTPPPPPPAQPNTPYAIPETRPIDKGRQFAAGLGAGLSKIQGPGKFASFARGAGQGLEGAEKNNQEQTKDNRAAQGQHFNQLSTSFRDMMFAQQQGNMEVYRAAQAKYLNARAASLANGTGGSKDAVNKAETRIQAFDTARRKSIDGMVTHGQWTEEQAAAAYKKLEQDTANFREQTYKAFGLDPQKVKEELLRGSTQAQPIDARTMTPDQFHSQVPMGAWFQDKNGVHQRTKGPPGQQTKGDQTSALETANDDEMAMSAEEQAIPEGQT
jgi:hypothetical protein